MTSQPETINLGNVANGAALEVFEQQLGEILKNIADVNTPAEAKRKLTLEFDFKPYPDRSGCIVVFQCKTKLAGVDAHESTIFLAKTTTGMRAYPRDVRQQILFNKPEGSHVVTMGGGAQTGPTNA